MKLARARAALARPRLVVPDDVKALAVPALAHRLVLNPELWVHAGSVATRSSRECLGAGSRRRTPAEGLRQRTMRATASPETR